MSDLIDFESFGRTKEEYDNLVKMWLWSAILYIEDGSTGWTKAEFQKALVGWLGEGIK